VGTTASGWLTDRVDPRKLLFAYYGPARSVADLSALRRFQLLRPVAVRGFLRLDWIATVPPTMAIANRAFGIKKAPILFGWISASHQIGAAAGGLLCRRCCGPSTGSYSESFIIAGFVAVVAGLPGPDDRHEIQARLPDACLGQ
jgi:hypothetical protein